MSNPLPYNNGKSYMGIGEIFFWTATINQWQKLLEPDEYKDIIVDSLHYLSNAGKIDVFGFVIMPNHIHLIWRTKELNGKETAQGPFLKYTAHEFRKILYKKNQNQLSSYQVDAHNKAHEFWQEILWQYCYIVKTLRFRNWTTYIIIRLQNIGNLQKIHVSISILQLHFMNCKQIYFPFLKICEMNF
jgi:REP element-mobilizing transposase RayT